MVTADARGPAGERDGAAIACLVVNTRRWEGGAADELVLQTDRAKEEGDISNCRVLFDWSGWSL